MPQLHFFAFGQQGGFVAQANIPHAEDEESSFIPHPKFWAPLMATVADLAGKTGPVERVEVWTTDLQLMAIEAADGKTIATRLAALKQEFRESFLLENQPVVPSLAPLGAREVPIADPLDGFEE